EMAGSRDDDELARRPSVLHVGMRFGNLVERVRAVDWNGEAACRNRVEVGLQHVGGKVGGVAAVRGEPDARRDVVVKGRTEMCSFTIVAGETRVRLRDVGAGALRRRPP